MKGGDIVASAFIKVSGELVDGVEYECYQKGKYTGIKNKINMLSNRVEELKKAMAGTIDHISMIIDNWGLEHKYTELYQRLLNERKMLDEVLHKKQS